MSAPPFALAIGPRPLDVVSRVSGKRLRLSRIDEALRAARIAARRSGAIVQVTREGRLVAVVGRATAKAMPKARVELGPGDVGGWNAEDVA